MKKHILNKSNQIIDSFFSTIEKRPAIVILLFILVNLLLKCYNLTEASYYLDEAVSIFNAQKPLRDIIQESFFYPHPPTYTILLSGWIRIFGISEVSTRLLSVIFSVATIPFLYQLAKKFFNIQTALYVLLFFIASNQHMYYSHEARSYTLVSLLTIVSFYLYFNILQKQKIKTILIYFLINTLLIYVHIIPVLVLLVQLIGALFHYKSLKRTFYLITISQLISISLLSIWLLHNKWIGGGETAWLPIPDLNNVYILFRRFFNTNLSLYISIFSIILLALKRSKIIDRKKFVILILWGLLPIVIVFIGSIIYNPRFIPKYMLFASPGLYLIVSYAISCIRFHSLIQIGLILIIFIDSMLYINLNPHKGEDWNKVASYIQKKKQQDDLLIVCADYHYVPFSFYYNREAFINYQSTKPILVKDNIHFTKTSRIFSKIDESGFTKTFLLLSHESIADPNGTTYHYLAERYQLIEEIPGFRGIKVYVFNTSKHIKK